MKLPGMTLLSFLVMVGNVNAQSNSVYVEQIGSGSTINFTQTGTGNAIGSSAAKAVVNGNNNTVTIDQIGNTNVAALNAVGDGMNISSITNGNGNSVAIDCGSSGDCTGSTITNTITGNGNSLMTNSDNLIDSTVNINSDNNTVTINNTSTSINGAKSNINISGGDGNTVALTQAGAAGANGHDTDITIVGATNIVDVKQGGGNDSKVNATITGSGNNLSINSNLP